jgi:hypothetical protein
MSTTKEILNEVKAVLEADGMLKVYVQKIELGLRRGIPQQDFPIIMVEPATVIEAYQAFPQIDAHFGIVVAGYTRAFDLEARLVGDANYKGILELEKDIKLALGLKYPTLNGHKKTCKKRKFLQGKLNRHEPCPSMKEHKVYPSILKIKNE